MKTYIHQLLCCITITHAVFSAQQKTDTSDQQQKDLRALQDAYKNKNLWLELSHAVGIQAPQCLTPRGGIYKQHQSNRTRIGAYDPGYLASQLHAAKAFLNPPSYQTTTESKSTASSSSSSSNNNKSDDICDAIIGATSIGGSRQQMDWMTDRLRQGRSLDPEELDPSDGCGIQ